MKYIGHPIVGDRVYGYNNKTDRLFDGQLLHAYLLGFNHPRTGAYIEFESAIPQYFYKIMDIRE
jgi:23S rRNA pseudouridine1911/1915/1917 synthase